MVTTTKTDKTNKLCCLHFSTFLNGCTLIKQKQKLQFKVQTKIEKY